MPIQEKTEKKVLDSTDSYYIRKGIIYSYDGENKRMNVFHVNNGSSFYIEGIYNTPVIYNGYIYYTRSKSRSDAFQEGDSYYLCRKEIEQNAGEEIVYETDQYIFGYVVLEKCVFMSLGKCDKQEDFFCGQADQKEAPHAAFVQYDMRNKEEK